MNTTSLIMAAGIGSRFGTGVKQLEPVNDAIEADFNQKTVTGADEDGKVIDVNALVSMNMWGLTPEFLDVLEEGFKDFLRKKSQEIF